MNVLCKIDSVVMIRIDFEWMNYVNLILNKKCLNVKWFMFECIYLKMDLTINLRLKSVVEVKSNKL